MALNETQIDAPPERVFAVLADWRAYGEWVVGSKYIRDADDGFPAVGTRFHHAVGVGPLEIKDHSQVIEIDQPRKFVLHVKARPMLTAIVEMTMEPRDGGTHVTMREDPGDRLSALLFMPITHLLVRGRNAESLRRLKDLAENRPEYGATVSVAPGKLDEP